jgi:hypothetical protein
MNYYLRTTDKDGKAYGGFQWPMEIGAIVTAPDWLPTNDCGNGLHGLLNGLGNPCHLSFETNKVWWIVAAANAIDLSGKHKFETCRVISFGSRKLITSQMNALVPGAVHGLEVGAGDDGTATAGYDGTATAVDYGTATAGDYGTATAGYNGTATAGHKGTATAGHNGTATAGYNGTATAGYNGTATAGHKGTATAGDKGVLVFESWVSGRKRLLVAYVGEDGILPNVAYRASEDFKSVVAHKGDNV